MCSCRNGSKTAPASYVVVLPGGKTKSYSSQITAEAEVKRTPGAYLATSQTGAI